jgi:uncharacterized protein (DUF4415 family)
MPNKIDIWLLESLWTGSLLQFLLDWAAKACRLFQCGLQAERKGVHMNNLEQKIRPLTDAEEAQIQAQIAANPDAPEATDEELANLTPFNEAFPDFAESIRRARGRPALENPRQQISIRLDPDVIEKFKSTGKGWQSRMNEILRKAVIE